MSSNDKTQTEPSTHAPADDRLFSPSAARNRDAIAKVFAQNMPTSGNILELAGGSGEHAVHLARTMSDASWLTGDPDLSAQRSIAAWIAESKLPNLRGPHGIDVAADDWGVETQTLFAGIVCINMVHIAPFDAAEGLFAGAKGLLAPGGQLFLYGPFSRNGVHTAPSNIAFDDSLKARNPLWGVRDLEQEIVPLGEENALELLTVVEMPANNLSVVFGKV